MGAGRILAGAVVGVIVSAVMLVLFWWIPFVGGILAVAIGGCAAGLVARGAGAGAAAGCLSTLLVVGAIAALAGWAAESITNQIKDMLPFLEDMLPGGIEVGGGIFIVLLILSIPTACCMTISGAIGGAINKPPKKPVTVEVKPQERVVVRERRGALYCPYCGERNLPDALYCNECGEKLPE